MCYKIMQFRLNIFLFFFLKKVFKKKSNYFQVLDRFLVQRDAIRFLDVYLVGIVMRNCNFDYPSFVFFLSSISSIIFIDVRYLSLKKMKFFPSNFLGTIL